MVKDSRCIEDIKRSHDSIGLFADATARQYPKLSLIVHLQAAKETKTLQSTLEKSTRDLQTLQAELLELSKSNAALQERATLQEEVGQHISDRFRSLSSRALQENNRAFLDLAESVLSKHIDAAKQAPRPTQD